MKRHPDADRGSGGGALRSWQFALQVVVISSALLPLYIIVKQALSPELESLAWPPRWWPAQLTVAHFASLFTVSDLRAAIVRSLAVALAAAALATLMGAMLGYAMARSKVGRAVGLGAVSVLRLLPMIAVAIPLAVVLIRLGLYDRPEASALALIHAAIALPTAALTSYAGFVAIPERLEEAAWLDGASFLRTFVTIDLPLAKGALAAAFMLSFILSWDEFGFALLIQVTHRTLPPLLYYYTAFGNIGPASALALMMTIPALAIVIGLRPLLRGALMAGSFR